MTSTPPPYGDPGDPGAQGSIGAPGSSDVPALRGGASYAPEDLGPDDRGWADGGPPMPSAAMMDALVDAVVDRIEQRVVDELERRGRRQSWGNF